MIPVKVLCGCGQKYAFDIQPVNGRMPSPVACPVCGTDGTAAANQVIAQTLASQPPPQYQPAPAPAPPPPAPTMLRSATAPPPTAAAASALVAAASRLGAKDDSEEWGPGGVGDTWKWYYYILAGIAIGGYSIWQAYTKESIKPLGELFLAVFCICIGIWDFNRKRKKKRPQG